MIAPDGHAAELVGAVINAQVLLVPHVHHAVPLADAEHDGLLTGAAPGLALDAARAEVALVDLDMPAKGALELARLGHALAQTTEKSIDGVAVEAGELGDLDGREISGHVPQKSADNTLRNS